MTKRKWGDRYYRNRFTILFFRTRSLIRYLNFKISWGEKILDIERYLWELVEFFTNFEYRQGKWVWIKKGFLGEC